ncbi:phosphatase PAP2 family protein [Aureimonas jatrophae]|jgi:undecaprenyl-diphosphatase|uniref:Undecaprenyl-diphosphatase n=1 Tax=Aureimonas jatrophae TaxID=1166073 RepID=A0A1H0KL85_9HYPH|nr:phosphatase PAP2 family protein [Aureimonas jatrophae]MBB3948763.1 undecaprenyl-diphosphatase [Aureimonas jatrophae]SDO56655.1 undecaprenyl-diphosphatase [Aureimonas jatrophae]
MSTLPRSARPIWRSIFERLEIRGLVVLLLASGAIGAFLAIAGEVGEGDTHAFDDAILLWFRTPGDPSDPIGPLWVELAFRDITALGGMTVLTLITVTVAAYLALVRKWSSALLVLASVLGAILVSSLLKLGFDRPRPDVVSHLVDVHTLSFPSGHAMLSAATYLTLGALLSRTQAALTTRIYLMGVAIALTLLIGTSRIFLGVHYPTDVLAGWCAGSAWALLCWTVARWLQHRGDVEPSS